MSPSGPRLFWLLPQLWALPFGPGTRTGLAGFATPLSNGRAGTGASQARGSSAALPLTPTPKAQPTLSYLFYLGWRLPQSVTVGKSSPSLNISLFICGLGAQCSPIILS